MLSVTRNSKNSPVVVKSYKQLTAREFRLLDKAFDGLIRLQTAPGQRRPPKAFRVYAAQTLARLIGSKLIRLVRSETYPSYGAFSVYELTKKGLRFLDDWSVDDEQQWLAENPLPAVDPTYALLKQLPDDTIPHVVNLVEIMTVDLPGLDLVSCGALTIRQAMLTCWRIALPDDIAGRISPELWGQMFEVVGEHGSQITQ